MPRAAGVTAIVLDSGLNPVAAEDDDDGDTVKPFVGKAPRSSFPPIAPSR